jgi:methylglutaconyl-CoA hydratase
MTDPISKILTAQDARGVVTVTLNRPQRSNALDREMLAALNDACERWDADASVRVVIVRGAGKNFCSGADVAAAGEAHQSQVSIPELCGRFAWLGKPTIAVVQGACIGAGLALAAGCDAVLAMPDAFFAIPEVRLGFPPAELTPIFLQDFGVRFLRRYLLSGERFDAAVAAQAGLVHRICAAADMEDAVATAADAYLRAAPGAVRGAKSALLGLAANLADLDLHALHARAIAGEEAREGIASFKDRRHPRWYLPRPD